MASFFEVHFCKRERVWSFWDMFSVLIFTSSISLLVRERRVAGDDHLDEREPSITGDQLTMGGVNLHA